MEDLPAIEEVEAQQIENLGGLIIKEEWIYVGPNNQPYSKEYRLNGRLHRQDGPAMVYYEEGKLKEERWFQHGSLHRQGGPAVTVYGDEIEEEYWERGKKIEP